MADMTLPCVPLGGPPPGVPVGCPAPDEVRPVAPPALDPPAPVVPADCGPPSATRNGLVAGEVRPAPVDAAFAAEPYGPASDDQVPPDGVPAPPGGTVPDSGVTAVPGVPAGALSGVWSCPTARYRPPGAGSAGRPSSGTPPTSDGMPSA